MTEISTIQLRKDVIRKLKQAKEYPRQPYNELLEKMAAVFMAVKERDQYDKFLHNIQQPVMKKLWNNPEDEVWNDV